MKNPILLFIVFGLTTILHAQKIVVQPYLQDVTPHSLHIMWETSEGGTSQVVYGTDKNLSDTAHHIHSFVNNAPSQIHRAHLHDLLPETTYYYKVSTGNDISPVYRFVTPAMSEKEASFKMVAMSDMQRDDGQPEKFKEIVEQGVLGYYNSKDNPEHITEELDLIIIPGDLVRTGQVYTDWLEDFWSEGEALFPYIPIYPVLGNHENNAQFYFNYFHLPDNGTEGYREHWWYKDYSNVRIVGLNSNHNYRVREQLDWLDDVLDKAETNDAIDFVFAQLHHPHKSELWLDGEIDFTGEVIRRLEDFSTRSGKPSIHFFGHTHGYSRGQSRDHKHLWVNVAGAAGNIDYWDEYAQRDYEEFTVTQTEYGFVVLEVEAGDKPKFVLKRINRGTEKKPTDNRISDVITIHRHPHAPERPKPLYPLAKSKVSPKQLTLKAGDFVSVASEAEHGESQWQVSRSGSFTHPDIDIRKTSENWYGDQNTEAGKSLTELPLEEALQPDTEYRWRVRYRTKTLDWSDWSEVQKFQTKK